LLVDDNPDMLSALVQMLQRDFVILGALTNGGAVLARAQDPDPDVILLDVSLGDITGFQLAERLRHRGCLSRVVFLSVHENPEFIRTAVNVGASGYVFKSQISRDLVNALQAAAGGRQFFPDAET
jgi:DNA-binding NarL/FixJ family response regulator